MSLLYKNSASHVFCLKKKKKGDILWFIYIYKKPYKIKVLGKKEHKSIHHNLVSKKNIN